MTAGRPSRRALLGGSAALAAGVGGLTLASDLPRRGAATPDRAAAPAPAVAAPIPFYGDHQAGITTRQQAHAAYLGLDLRRGTTARDVAALLAMLTDDAARLCAGQPPLGALEAESAAETTGLTVTFGLGPGLFAAAGVPQRCPRAVRALPRFARDELEQRWGQTDLVLCVAADDPTGLAYAQRRLLRDAAHACTTRWVQRGFVTPPPSPRGPGSASSAGSTGSTESPGGTAASPRNLLGMRDGSANERDPAQLADVVWSTGPGAMAGGTQLVLRRIRLDLDRWDDLDTAAKELSFGRRVGDGSPLSAPPGTSEFTAVDRSATDAHGFTVVPPAAHAARAQARSSTERMLRRSYNYDDGPRDDGTPDAGLLFVAYQRDIAAAFVPVQQRLAQTDALNAWSTHVGSAVYAVPPGIRPGDWVGRQLLT